MVNLNSLFFLERNVVMSNNPKKRAVVVSLNSFTGQNLLVKICEIY